MDRLSSKAKFYIMLLAFFGVLSISAIFAYEGGAIEGIRANSIGNTFMILLGFLLLNGPADS